MIVYERRPISRALAETVKVNKAMPSKPDPTFDAIERLRLSALTLSALKNDSETGRRLKASADGGDADAQYKLGMAYNMAEYGLSRDYDEGQRYIRLGARQGHEGAKRSLETFAPRVGLAKWLYMRGLGYK
jgi:hypothetical protein